MKNKGSLGWIFLAVVLAVPALMYYKSSLGKERERQLAEKAKIRVPEGGLFPEPSDAQKKLSNPITDGSAPALGTTAPAPASVAASTEAASQAAATVVDATQGNPPQPGQPPAPEAANVDPQGGRDARPPASTAPEAGTQVPQQAAAPAPAVPPQPQAPSAAPAPMSQAQASQPAPQAAPASQPQVQAPQAQASTAPPGAEVALSSTDLVAVDWRDPLLSPYDQFLVEQEQLELLIKRKEVEDQARQAKAQRERPVEQTLSLQGIINTPEGNKVIINNDMYGEGEWVGNTGVKILKISQNGVVCSYKGRSFVKRMQ